MFGNPQPSTPPLQASCASDLALSPEVRPSAEPMPIYGHIILSYLLNHTHTPYLTYLSPNFQSQLPSNRFCPWGRWEGENWLWGTEILWRDGKWDKEWEDKIIEPMTLVDYSAMTHHCLDQSIIIITNAFFCYTFTLWWDWLSMYQIRTLPRWESEVSSHFLEFQQCGLAETHVCAYCTFQPRVDGDRSGWVSV